MGDVPLPVALMKGCSVQSMKKGRICSPVKFAVLSHILPPSPSGTATMLYRLLRDLGPDDYCLISKRDYTTHICSQDSGPPLPARYYHVPSSWRLPTLNLPLIRTARASVNALVQLIQRAIGVIRIIQCEECRAIIACTADEYDLPAAYLTSLWARIPFYAYVFDDYVYQWTDPFRRLFAKRVAPTVMQGAAGVIVPNEFLRDEYRQRYGIEPVVLHNPCESFLPRKRILSNWSYSLAGEGRVGAFIALLWLPL